MFSWVEKSVSSCLGPLKNCVSMDDNQDLQMDDDALIWSRDLERHFRGEFSFAVVQANAVLEDQSQVQTGPHATFVGVYDGHGGTEASRYVCNNLFQHLLRLAGESRRVSEDIIRNAFSQTEEGFLNIVRRDVGIKPNMTSIGSCCLVGVFCEGTLYVANLGDSRAVLGYLGSSNKIVAEQLTQDHNASVEAVRNELKELHPHDPQIVLQDQGVWRVKGITQISRSIGDAHLKKTEFALNATSNRHYLPEYVRRSVLRADPAITTRNLQPTDKFIIFASDGLWELLTNKEAVEIVHKNPRLGIAKRLLMMAMKKASKIRKTPYSDIKILPAGRQRRNIHDDITIVVIFIDPDNTAPPQVSVRGFVNNVGQPDFIFE
ncbi:hypothetical protein BUALT_Bualt11G0115600 [Buddleja alternifolia]|uniref:protein-serine/threonine phosphatase n=1 Tax=Buddleja alternifolia TaxID=168488 RepID=A0AAV6WZ25_9LAMI|nr:hypothetical protein BUALT_Bualt11G0115600 [Buddleja alternifolia]